MVSCDKLVYTICDGAISFSDSLILRWVNQAWRDIREEMVRRSFKTCGTSITHSTAQKEMQSSTRIFQNKKKSEDEEMDDEFETDSEEDYLVAPLRVIKVHIVTKPSNLVRLVSEYTFICYCFNLLRKFFLSKILGYKSRLNPNPNFKFAQIE